MSEFIKFGRAIGLLVALLVAGLLTGCAGAPIARNDNYTIDKPALEAAKHKHQEMVKIAEISRHLSEAAVGVCKYKFPKLDFAAQALPTKSFIEEDEAQAIMRVSPMDEFPRVIRSWNPAIKVGARIERVGSTKLETSQFGDAFQRALASEAEKADSIEIVIDGVARMYTGRESCAEATFVRLESKPKGINLTRDSDRFIGYQAGAVKVSDEARVFETAMHIALAAGGNADNAMLARKALMASTLLPIVPLFVNAIAGPIVKATIDQEKLEKAMLEILKAGGYDAAVVASVVSSECGNRCASTWTSARKERWGVNKGNTNASLDGARIQ